jgi:regulation of enolase protein 1 (concanavalin A-like superfamily)
LKEKPTRAVTLESLEPRQLFAWGPYPQLIDQDLATATYPQVNGAGQVIAVIDSGVNLTHPNLAGKFWTNPGEIPNDGIDNDHDGYIDDVHGYDFYRNDPNPDDEVGHGTAVAGIIAATPFTYNGATYAGVAPAARIIALKVLDTTSAYSPGTEFRIEKALQWVEAMNKRFKISAVNLSLYTPPAAYAATYADEIKRLSAAGVIISASGGQDNPNADAHYPSADPLVYATTVVDQNDHLSNIVNRGPMIDLLAPGNAVPILNKTGSGFLLSSEGSSYAAPHTTAAAALLRQIDHTFSSTQVLSILKDSGQDVTDTSTQFTYSGLTYKRLDLDDAIKLAYQRRNAPTPPSSTPPSPTPPPPPPPTPPPTPGITYTSADIGGAKTPGLTTTLTPGRDYDLTTSAADVWNNSDQFRFLYRPITGDFDARVRLQSLDAPNSFIDPWSKAGLMLRDSLSPTAKNLFAFATPSTNGTRFSYRPTASASTTIAPTIFPPTYPNTWLRLKRQANTFTAYTSPNGQTWTLLGATTLTLNSTLYLGLAATSHNGLQTATAHFRDWSIL